MFVVSRHDFSGKVFGARSPWKTLHSDTWIFLLTGTNFRVMFVRNYKPLRWNVNKMLLQASINIVKKWLAEVIEILHTTLYETAYLWIKRQNVWRRNTHPCLTFFFNDNSFNQSVTQWNFCACFLRTMSEILGRVVERNTLMPSWELFEIAVLFYGHHWRESCLTQINILKRYNNFKCTFRQRW